MEVHIDSVSPACAVRCRMEKELGTDSATTGCTKKKLHGYKVTQNCCDPKSLLKSCYHLLLGHPVETALNMGIREGSRYQIGWIFGKVPKGKGVIFNPKIYIADFGNFKQGFLIMKLIKRRVISGFRVCFFNDCIAINWY